MTTSITPRTLEDAVDCFNTARYNLFEGAVHLHTISKQELWKDHASSFGEWVEENCKISQSMASKLISVVQHYEIEGGLSHEKLVGIDAEKLYLAAKLPLPTEEQLEHARTLTRAELKISKAEGDAHTPEFGSFCKHCWLAESNHP